MVQCWECGKEFAPSYRGRKKEFCDRACQLVAYNRKRRARTLRLAKILNKPIFIPQRNK